MMAQLLRMDLMVGSTVRMKTNLEIGVINTYFEGYFNTLWIIDPPTFIRGMMWLLCNIVCL